METRLLYLYTESPLHAGVGSGLSTVDLPIQRERTTQYPNIQGSGIKGALRSQCLAPKDELEAVFGPDTDNAADYAGAASIGEARIVLFPVRSLLGTFAYTTCPQVLARLRRDLQRAGIPNKEIKWTVPTIGKNQSSLVTTQSVLHAQGQVVLEEFSFSVEANPNVDAIARYLAATALPQDEAYMYWQQKVQNSLIILPDDAFRDFVVNSTEVVTRVRLVPDTKTVAQGALWTQETLPADTLMVSSVTARKLRLPLYNGEGKLTKAIPEMLGDGGAATVINWIMQPENLPYRVQIGGDETTGHGLVALRWQ